MPRHALWILAAGLVIAVIGHTSAQAPPDPGAAARNHDAGLGICHSFSVGYDLDHGARSSAAQSAIVNPPLTLNTWPVM